MMDKANCAEIFTDKDLELCSKHQNAQQLHGVLTGTIATKDCGIKAIC
jgi:phosphopantetheinyl transferase (holo-ACP synthase)